MTRATETRIRLLLRAALSLPMLLAADGAFAQLEPETPEEQEEQAIRNEERRQVYTWGGHTFVPPLSIRSTPFEFAIPLAQLASRTTASMAWVNDDRNVDQGPTDAQYAQLSQVYDLSLRFGYFEIAASPILNLASGLDSESLATGGAAATGGGSLAVAYRLIPFDRVAVTLRLTARFEGGYRANIEPLLYQVETNAVALLNQEVDVGSLLGTPSTEIGGAAGLSGAFALSPRFSIQASLRLDAVVTQIKPWLSSRGTRAAGPSEFTFEAWNPSAGLAFGAYVTRDLLLQGQLGVSRHESELDSPPQEDPPHTRTTYLVFAGQLMYLASPILQLGGGVGGEHASTDVRDPYANEYDTSAWSLFVQLTARFIWGQSWPGN